MFHDRTGLLGLQARPCRYGTARVTFRGPQADPSFAHIAFIGGSETFGPYVEAPFPTLIAEALGPQAMNLGVRSAGPDVFLGAGDLLQQTRGAAATIVQAPLVGNLSNPFYRVHGLRNDRLITVTRDFYAKAPEFDICDIHFINHFWQEARRLAPQVVAPMEKAVRALWVERMQTLLGQLAPPVYLLWLRGCAEPSGHSSGGQPQITQAMIDALSGHVTDTLTMTPPDTEPATARAEMAFPPEDFAQVSLSLTPMAHRAIAGQLLKLMAKGQQKTRAG